eukprot:CAMPEP_0203914228 /NCGR_PEP_ID=MMETSP0359-20131031/55135_1 /ASSEMBLY_ACC=CAM_ASM_000338 /TAXON_ID=268821 /ORGANISM="Scrippsiella Hangoei, Strain SHTV-5" /LENGTH=94 /DNA_ID=CAMNT_0050840515 /DNA_START=567 /DNA_END=851 /DNA_ORIENTATION=-
MVLWPALGPLLLAMATTPASPCGGGAGRLVGRPAASSPTNCHSPLTSSTSAPGRGAGLMVVPPMKPASAAANAVAKGTPHRATPSGKKPAKHGR